MTTKIALEETAAARRHALGVSGDGRAYLDRHLAAEEPIIRGILEGRARAEAKKLRAPHRVAWAVASSVFRAIAISVKAIFRRS